MISRRRSDSGSRACTAKYHNILKIINRLVSCTIDERVRGESRVYFENQILAVIIKKKNIDIIIINIIILVKYSIIYLHFT